MYYVVKDIRPWHTYGWNILCDASIELCIWDFASILHWWMWKMHASISHDGNQPATGTHVHRQHTFWWCGIYEDKWRTLSDTFEWAQTKSSHSSVLWYGKGETRFNIFHWIFDRQQTGTIRVHQYSVKNCILRLCWVSSYWERTKDNWQSIFVMHRSNELHEIHRSTGSLQQIFANTLQSNCDGAFYRDGLAWINPPTLYGLPSCTQHMKTHLLWIGYHSDFRSSIKHMK